MTIAELQELVKEYVDHGYMKDVAAAAKQAHIETRDFIARTHPHTAFGGMSIGGSQIIRGRFEVTTMGNVNAVVYANYFSRWYNTGAFGRTIRGSGPRRGQRGPSYPSRGDYFGKNKAAIEEFYASRLEAYLKTHISL